MQIFIGINVDINFGEKFAVKHPGAQVQPSRRPKQSTGLIEQETK